MASFPVTLNDVFQGHSTL